MSEVLIAAIARLGAGAVAEKILTQFGDLETSRITLFTSESVRDASTRLHTQSIARHGAAVASDYLRSIGIFPDAAHYYNIAIDEGRCVVTYNASAEEAPIIEERFRACGFVKVRRFPFAGALAGARAE